MVQNNAKLITHMVSPHLLRSNWKNNCKKCKSDRTYGWFVHLKPFCQTSKLEFWNCSKLQQRHLWNERLLRKGWYMWIMCFFILISRRSTTLFCTIWCNITIFMKLGVERFQFESVSFSSNHATSASAFSKLFVLSNIDSIPSLNTNKCESLSWCSGRGSIWGMLKMRLK